MTACASLNVFLLNVNVSVSDVSLAHSTWVYSERLDCDCDSEKQTCLGGSHCHGGGCSTTVLPACDSYRPLHRGAACILETACCDQA